MPGISLTSTELDFVLDSMTIGRKLQRVLCANQRMSREERIKAERAAVIMENVAAKCRKAKAKAAEA